MESNLKLTAAGAVKETLVLEADTKTLHKSFSTNNGDAIFVLALSETLFFTVSTKTGMSTRILIVNMGECAHRWIERGRQPHKKRFTSEKCLRHHHFVRRRYSISTEPDSSNCYIFALETDLAQKIEDAHFFHVTVSILVPGTKYSWNRKVFKYH